MVNIGTGVVRVVIADDYEPQREAIRAILSLIPGVDIVATCSNGQEAVEAIVEAGDVDVAVLDLEMPQTDGLAAAELLATYRPDVSVVLFTSHSEGDVRRRAAELAVPVLDKLATDDLIALLARERHASGGAQAGPSVEPLVLSAVAVHRDEAFLVVRADGTVAYYNVAAAELHDLPFPPSGELPFEEFRASLPTVWRDGTRRPPETRPIARALAERAPVSDEVCELRDGVVHVYSATAIPFFDDARRYLGAAVYWRYQEQFALGAGGYPASRSGRA